MIWNKQLVKAGDRLFVFFIVISLIIPFTITYYGFKYRKKAPGKMSLLQGYRTTWSMKSRATWEFAHRFFGKILSITGIPVGIASVIVLCFFINSGTNEQGNVLLIVTAAQAVVMLLPLIPTEIALRKHFDKNGKKKPEK